MDIPGNLKEKILPYALANAIKFDGKANHGSVIGAVIGKYPELKESMKAVAVAVSEAIREISKIPAEQQRKQLEELDPELLEKKESTKRIGLPELPNVSEPVKMRIAPYPSGPLHIGNAKQLIINDEYAKRYNGKLVLFYDDTIGSEEKNISPEAYELIKEGALWLGCNINEEYYKSDRMQTYYEYAQQIINKGKAYVCICSSETLRYNREKSIECGCRSKSIEQVLNDWTAMLLGSFDEGKAALRLKTDMKHRNPAFRDRVLFRISKREHPRTGNKYHVWPLLEFSWAIDDHLIDITHILRGKDLMMESEMERYIWDIFGWKHPEIIHTGLVQIEGVKISKSKSKQEVASGVYTGWDDPRTWSLQSLKRRGIQPKAIRDFCIATGLNANEVTVPVDNLYSENRKILDITANRYFFVAEPISIHVAEAPESEVELKLHPDFPERGKRHFKTGKEFLISKHDHEMIAEGNLYRLMDCLNFRKEGNLLVFVDKDVETYRREGKRIMHWLPADDKNGKNNVDVEVLMDDGSIVKGKGESSLSYVHSDTIVQFERFGFCRIDTIEKNKGNETIKCWFAHK